MPNRASLICLSFHVAGAGVWAFKPGAPPPLLLATGTDPLIDHDPSPGVKGKSRASRHNPLIFIDCPVVGQDQARQMSNC
jgi:hypothetical protein